MKKNDVKEAEDRASLPKKNNTTRVLIVDDSPMMCSMIRQILSSEKNLEIEICTDPEKAIESAELFSPTVILQGLHMGKTNGFDLLRLYRTNRSTSIIPVLILSAEEDIKIKEKAFSLGANDYLLKSGDKAEFIARVLYHSRRYINIRKNKSVSRSFMVPAKHSIKVLMIDDSLFQLKLMAKIFSKEKDITFKPCTDPLKAAIVADDYLPTVIILCLVVGKYSGFEILKWLRENQSTKDVPIVVLSSNDDAAKKARVFASGANDYFVKSDKSDELISRIRSHSSEYFNLMRGQIQKDLSASGDDDPIKVFMVDDSNLICNVTKQLLTSEKNVLFSFCTDSATALESAKKFSPTVILQDLNMPQIDGLDLLRFFREEPATRDVPIIVLSGVSDPTIKAKAFGLGANDFMEKRMDKIELLSRIQYHTKAYINSLKLSESIEKSLEIQKRLEIHGNFIRKTFGRYLSDDIVNSILESPDGLELGGEKREVTIMMTDLRGFTSIGERLSPEKVLTIINNYLRVMTDILIKYGGTIDEFIGDAILAIFGAPVRNKKHAEVAVACAIEMQTAMKTVNQINKESGLPEVEMGIGLNTGEVVVGNIGCEKRTKYGVIGKNVNLTSRIESYTCGGQILISESSMEKVQGILKVRGEMTAEPKGIKGPITIYDVCGIGGGYNLELPEEKLDFKKLPESVPVDFSVIEGKSKSKETAYGQITHLSDKGAIIRSETVVELMKNVRITPAFANGAELDGEIFGKVMENPGGLQDNFMVRFTYLDKGLKNYFQKALQG